MPELTNDEKLKHCVGCRDNFYNREDSRCWMLDRAKLKRRFRTGTWTDPTQPGAFAEVEVLSCYHRSGIHFTDTLPQCAVGVEGLDK